MSQSTQSLGSIVPLAKFSFTKLQNLNIWKEEYKKSPDYAEHFERLELEELTVDASGLLAPAYNLPLKTQVTPGSFPSFTQPHSLW